MEERARFVLEAKRNLYTVEELCDRFDVSHKTGHKWLARYREGGLKALQDQSKVARTLPHTTDPELVREILKCRGKHPTWGPRKIIRILQDHYPQAAWPACSTAGDILKRHGLVKDRKRRQKLVHPGRPTTDVSGPNDLWAADFKGEFRTEDGRYCYPLTVTDGFSRYLLACKGLPSTAEEGARPVFKRLFREYGLPAAILSDNGAPFASVALHRFSRLSVWWIRLGIQPLLIQPGHPEQNGRHERMHRTLKKEATKPPKADMDAQQREFDRFQAEYNDVRPHEAIGLRTPASCYQASPRPFPEKLPPFEYPAHFKVRKVASNSAFRWTHRFFWLSRTLIGEYIGLEEVDDGIFSIFFCNVLLGRFDVREWKLHA